MTPSDPDGFEVEQHRLLDLQGRSPWVSPPGAVAKPPLDQLRDAARQRTAAYVAVCAPILEARFVQLSLVALRKDAFVERDLALDSSGLGLAAVVGKWRGAQPDKTKRLEDFVHKCIPAIQNVFVKPGDMPGTQGLWIRQEDDQEFDARHVSDGVLLCTALAAHILSAERGTLIMVEEPELGIHPPMLHELVELIRRMVAEYECQFLLTTHSRVLVDEFRDEPDAILRFRRTKDGTLVQRASDVPALLEALESSTPGDLLQSNLFNAV
ncbi:MAG: ATP-binding protein [Polyangia bacterium]